MNSGIPSTFRAVAVLAIGVATFLPTPNVSAQEESTELNPVYGKTFPEGKLFVFEGGPFKDFVEQIDQTYEVDLYKIADIPYFPLAIRVPKMRLNTQSLRDPLEFYSRVAAMGRPRLGEWLLVPTNSGELGAIILSLRMNDDDTPKLSSRAFYINPLDTQDLGLLIELIERQKAQVEQFFRSAYGHVGIGIEDHYDDQILSGDFGYHRPTSVITITGSPFYVDMASEAIQAFQERAEVLESQKAAR